MIQPISLIPISAKKHLTFKKEPTKQDKINKSLEKQAFINSKTSANDNFALGLLVLSLFLNVHNINFSKKISTSQKLGLGTFALSTALFVHNCIKKYNLSKQFEKENI